jgi:hypothetical protein
MRSISHVRIAAFAGLLALIVSAVGFADQNVGGRVVDLNGKPVAGAMVSLTLSAKNAGANVISVFTGARGQFRFPERVESVALLEVRSLELEQLEPVGELAQDLSSLTIVMQPRRNQAAVAPASAWMIATRRRSSFATASVATRCPRRLCAATPD